MPELQKNLSLGIGDGGELAGGMLEAVGLVFPPQERWVLGLGGWLCRDSTEWCTGPSAGFVSRAFFAELNFVPKKVGRRWHPGVMVGSSQCPSRDCLHPAWLGWGESHANPFPGVAPDPREV